jgi:virulence factor
MTDARPLRVGLVGAGAIGRLAQLPVLASDPTVVIAGVVTASAAESAEVTRRWPVERGYENAEQLISDGRLDALFVLTPKHLHTPFVRMGLAAGLDVYCEKPLAATLDDAAALVEAAAAARGHLMVGLNRRYAATYQRAREVFAQQPPEFVVGQKNRVGTEYRATLENGIHMIDLLRWFCGEATKVTAAAHADDPYRESGCAALIRFDSGATALFVASRSAGEWDERLEAYGGGTTVRVLAPDEVSIVRGGIAETYHERPAAQGWADITETAGFAPAIRAFLESVRSGEAPQPDAREAYRSQELMESVLASAGLPTVDKPEGSTP